MRDRSSNLESLGIIHGKMRWVFFFLLACLLGAGSSDNQKEQSIKKDPPSRPNTISIKPKLVKGKESYQLVFYQGPQIDLENVAVNEIKIAVVDAKEVMARSHSGSKALASLNERARKRQGILQAQQKKLKIIQEDYEGKAEGAPGKLKLEREFITESEKYQQIAKKFQVELLNERTRIVYLYTSRIRKAVEVVALREEFDLVLDKLKDVQAAKDLLSPEVKELLNQDLGDITSETVQEMDTLY